MMLLELAVRCEAATGPDRRLDCEIEAAIGKLKGEFRVVGPPAYDPKRYFSGQEGMDWIGYDLLNVGPRHTASIDAAMTLVPEGYRWTLTGDASGSLPFRYNASVCERRTGLEKPSYGSGATPALAMDAAALRARAAQELVGSIHHG